MKQRIRLTGGQLNRVVNESVRMVLNEKKQTLDVDHAEYLLKQLLQQQDLENDLYDCAYNIVRRLIMDINSKYTVLGDDKAPDTRWYELIKDDLIRDVMQKLQKRDNGDRRMRVRYGNQ